MQYSGYSKTPLNKKIGVKDGFVICAINAPDDYEKSMSPLPEGAVIIRGLEEKCDIVHAFYHEKSIFESSFPDLLAAIPKNGMIWISWPKKASKVESDLSEDVIRNYALSLGLVDVKVASYDHIYSCLKIVYRKKDR